MTLLHPVMLMNFEKIELHSDFFQFKASNMKCQLIFSFVKKNHSSGICKYNITKTLIKKGVNYNEYHYFLAKKL